MKKILVAVAAGALALSASAQTNTVLSRNAVGYQRIDLPANQFEFVSGQFNQLDGSPNVVSNVIPVATNGTQVVLWDAASQVYVNILRSKGTWGAPGTNPVPRGTGFFLRGAPTNSQTVYIMGEVPDKLTATQTVSFAVPGFNAKGSGYPVATAWTNTQLSQVLANGDQFIVWDNTADVYVTYLKSKNAWPGAGSNYVLRAGEGFFVRKLSSTTNTWTEPKPYTWP